MLRRSSLWATFDGHGWRTLAPIAARLDAANEHTLAQQVTIAQIAAPTGAEHHRALYMRDALQQCGWTEQRIDSAGNVVARWSPPHVDAELAPVSCLAHLDTVFDIGIPLTCTNNGSRMHCPGIGDNGRGLAAMLTIADMVRHTHIASLVQRPIELIATVGEEGEGNLRGARHYFERRAERALQPPIAVLVLDGPGDTAIVHHAVGSRRLRVRIEGAGGHSWVDYGTPNPLHALVSAASAIAQLGARRSSAVAVTISRIHGGESLTSIPKDAWFDVDLRSTSERALQLIDAEIRGIVHTAVQEASRSPSVYGTQRPDLALRATITMLGERPCGSLDATHSLVHLAQLATRWQGNEPVSAFASTDANIALARGVPAITIGAGGTGGGAHSLDEWFDNTNSMRGVARALSILIALAANALD